MRIAVIADIHGNLEAFKRVFTDIQMQQVDSIVSLGDNIGYGADSEKIIQLIRSHNITSILGNHEKAIEDQTVRKWFKQDAKTAIIQAMESLSEESMHYIKGLKTSLSVSDCLFVHGFPPDSTIFYLFQISDSRLLKTFYEMQESICFIGHTHMLGLVYSENNTIYQKKLAKGITLLENDKKYIVNAGSVGQPRDGDPNAKYLIWDSSTHELETRFIPYDVTTAARKIIDAGISKKFAQRLDKNIS